MSLCADCFKGVRHEGTPEVEYPKDKVLLFLTDGFGLKLENNLLLADDFARNGFKVVMPDFFEGDAASANALDPGVNFDIPAFLARHPPERATTIVRSMINVLKAEGVTKFGATGYCYGARLCFNFAFTGEVQAVTTAHPSLLQIPDELKKYLEVAKAPLLINSCETDSQFPIEAQKAADEILGDGKFAPGYLRTYWPGASTASRFAATCKLEVAAGKEGAFKASVEWLQKYL